MYRILGSLGLTLLVSVAGSKLPEDLVRIDGRTQSGYYATIGVGTIYGEPKPKIVLLNAINKNTIPRKISATQNYGILQSRRITIDDEVEEYQIECESPNTPKYEDTCKLKDSSPYNGKINPMNPALGERWKDMDKAERKIVEEANDLINQAIVEIFLGAKKI